MAEDREREGGSANWAEVPTRALLEGFAVVGTLLIVVVGLWAFGGPTGPAQRQDFRQSMGVLLAALVGLGGLYLVRVLAGAYVRRRAGSGPISEDERTLALARASPRGADPRRADLSRANLRAAALGGADLRAAILLRADLREADLREADLRRVLMSNAVLGGADLREADLREANLRGVDLRGANLSGADLSGAFGWTEAQFRAAGSLEGATMPDGRSYEEWLKDEGGHREGGENPGPPGGESRPSEVAD
jgi:hypothetical protein